MNSIIFLSNNEFENIKKNCDFTEQELYILEHMRKDDLTNEGMAMNLNISAHKFKQVKSLMQLKIYRQAAQRAT